MRGARSRKRTTVVNLCFQAAAVCLAAVSGVILVPLYLHHIPANLYGAWQASGNILTWITALDPGLSIVIQQRVAIAYGRKDASAVTGWIASGLLLTTAIALIVLTAGMVVSGFLSSWMNLPPTLDQATLATAFRWSAVASALMILSFSVTAANQGLQSSMAIGLIFVAVSVCRLLLVVFLLGAGYGLLAIAMPSVLMGVFLLGGNLVYLLARLRMEDIPFSPAPTRLRALAGLLSFTFASRSAALLANNMDLFVVARILGPDSVNVLRFTRTGPELSRMLVERPTAAMQPALAHLLGGGETDHARVILLRLLRITTWALTLLGTGFFVFNRDFVSLWVGEHFYAGTSVNVILVTGFVASAGAAVLSNLCFAAGNIRGNSLAGLAQVLVYLPLLWFGGYRFGMLGVVAASLLSLILTQCWYLPQVFARIYKLTSGDRVGLLSSMFLSVSAASVVAVVFSHVSVTTWPTFVVSVAAFGGCYTLLLVLISAEARAEARNGLAWILSRNRA